MFSFPTTWLSTLERGDGHGRVTVLILLVPLLFFLTVFQPTQCFTPEGGQCLVRVVTGYLVGTLEGDIQQVLLVPTKVNITLPVILFLVRILFIPSYCGSAHPVLHPAEGAVLGASGDRLPDGYPGGGYPAGPACPN